LIHLDLTGFGLEIVLVTSLCETGEAALGGIHSCLNQTYFTFHYT